MSTVEHLAQQALALAPEDRVYLADVLERSLTNGGFATADLAAEWAAEIDRRLAAYQQGETGGSDSAAALERIRERLQRHRQREAAS